MNVINDPNNKIDIEKIFKILPKIEDHVLNYFLNVNSNKANIKSNLNIEVEGLKKYNITVSIN